MKNNNKLKIYHHYIIYNYTMKLKFLQEYISVFCITRVFFQWTSVKYTKQTLFFKLYIIHIRLTIKHMLLYNVKRPCIKVYRVCIKKIYPPDRNRTCAHTVGAYCSIHWATGGKKIILYKYIKYHKLFQDFFIFFSGVQTLWLMQYTLLYLRQVQQLQK